MACVPACPSGVQYDRLIEQTRDYVEDARRRPLGERLLRARCLRRASRTAAGCARARAAPPAGARPARGARARRAAVARRGWPPEHSPAPGPRVALARRLRAERRVRRRQRGDGARARRRGLRRARAARAGLLRRAARARRALAEGVARARALPTTLGGLRPHRHQRRRLRLAPEGPRHRERRRRLGAARRKRRARRAPPAARSGSPSRTPATCATRRGSSMSRARCSPRSPACAVLEPAEQEICCGSAGIYNLVQPDAARELGERKARARARDRRRRVRERQSGLPGPGQRRAAPRWAGRCPRFTRSNCSTRRSAASTRRNCSRARAANSAQRGPRLLAGDIDQPVASQRRAKARSRPADAP